MRRWSRRLVLKRSSGAAGKAGAGGAYSRDFELGRDSGGSIHVPVSAGTAPRLWLRRDRRDRLGRRRARKSFVLGNICLYVSFSLFSLSFKYIFFSFFFLFFF